MTTHISEINFDPWQVMAEYQHQSQQTNQFGATAVFIGTMRDFNDNADVAHMVLEYYPAMTQHYLNKLELQAKQNWQLLDTLVIHRVGEIEPADPIVLIACWSVHRRTALDACNWLIEEVKHHAPFWKKETRQDGEHWVKHNTNGF